jgi:hypothetical protein
MTRIFERIGVFVAATLATAGPAMAGCVIPGTPAPVIGLGIPALVAFGIAYKRLRKTDDQ